MGKLTNHISTKWLWLQERVTNREIVMRKVGTTEQVADLLTKPVARPALDKATQATGLRIVGPT